MTRICVVGGSSGIGLAVVQQCLARGDHVVSVARRKTPLTHEHLRSIQADITQQPFLADAGTLDALVYTAGVARHEAIGSITDDALHAMIALNFIAALRVGEDAVRTLTPGGAVLFVASNLAHTPLATSAVYSATKAAMIAFAQSLALAGAARGIRVNTISPGLVDTPMIAGRPPTDLPIAKPEDIARQILELLAQPVTGKDFL